MPDPLTAHEITLTRVFDAPRRLVWDAWTQPDQLVRWWGARGWSTPLDTVTLDVRPGGVFRLTSVSEDGAEMAMAAVFTEVEEPDRLVVEEVAEESWHEGATSVVTFTDLGDGRTELTLRSTIHTSDAMRAPAEAGMAQSLDRLAEALS
jgi:uncharacterized protein YndB with AHSA1/START domain